MRKLICWLATTFALLSVSAAAEPIKLKLSFFTSDRSVAYQSAIKPFVDAVNAEGKGLVEIQVYLSGTLGKVQNELPQLVLDGTADMAFVVPGQNPERFSDTAVIELPGLFRDVREATLAYTRLVAANALAGYEDYFVIGAYATEPETIHSRKHLASLTELAGQKIRVNNRTEAAGLEKLGANPVLLAFNETSPAISNGTIDGATVPPAQLFDVGIGRLVSNHYLLGTSVAPLALLMNRKVFERLPTDARVLIQRYSGEWSAVRFIETYTTINTETVERIKSDERRSVVVPNAADADIARRAFQSIIGAWADKGGHNRELVSLVEAELGKIRAAK